MTIYQYWKAVFERHEVIDGMRHFGKLSAPDWGIDSVCGVHARRLIDKCADLVEAMREPVYQLQVARAVQREILVICFG
jgi:hypothetical protein